MTTARQVQGGNRGKCAQHQMRTYFGFCNLLDLPDFLVRHDIVEPDNVWAVPFILLFEGGDDQLGRPVAIM